MEEKWLTVKQAAEFLQCSAPTIRRRIADGSLKVMRSGRLIRIAESDLKAMMNPAQTKEEPDSKA